MSVSSCTKKILVTFCGLPRAFFAMLKVPYFAQFSILGSVFFVIFAKHLFYVAKKSSCSLCVFCKLAVFIEFFLYQRSSILFRVDMSSRSLNVIPSIIFPIFVVIHFWKRFLFFFFLKLPRRFACKCLLQRAIPSTEVISDPISDKNCK